MLFDIVVQIIAGVIIGVSLLVTAGALLHLPRRRAPEQAPPDHVATGATTTMSRPAAGRRAATRSVSGAGRHDIDAGDVPAGIRMTRLDQWDLLVVGLILAMGFAAVGATLALLLVAAVLVDALSRIWITHGHKPD